MNEDVCPKCRRPAKETDQACARCGLLRKHWATYDPRPPPHPLLDLLWEQALADWSNDKRHQALADAAMSDGSALSGLSQRYSTVLRERPDDPIAAAAQERLLQLALRLTPPVKSDAGDLWARVARGAFGVMLIVVSLMLLLTIFGKHR